MVVNTMLSGLTAIPGERLTLPAVVPCVMTMISHTHKKRELIGIGLTNGDIAIDGGNQLERTKLLSEGVIDIGVCLTDKRTQINNILPL